MIHKAVHYIWFEYKLVSRKSVRIREQGKKEEREREKE